MAESYVQELMRQVERRDAEIAQLRADLARVTAERDEWKHAAMTHTAAKVRAWAELDEARADVARMSAELDEAIEDRRQARDDAARAAALLAVRTLERDARPAISREDAALYIAHCNGVPYSRTPADERAKAIAETIGFERVEAALRAHAAGSGKGKASGGVCDACNDAGTVVVHGKEEQWDEPCPTCNGTGKRSEHG